VKAKVKDRYNEESGWSPVVTITISQSPFPMLNLNYPLSVREDTSFEVVVTSEGTPVENVQVTFLDTVYYTDSAGVVNLSAPSVDTTLEKTLLVQKEGRHTGSKRAALQGHR
jgi:hypothetical protein